jgi:hypothetical protein
MAKKNIEYIEARALGVKFKFHPGEIKLLERYISSEIYKVARGYHQYERPILRVWGRQVVEWGEKVLKKVMNHDDGWQRELREKGIVISNIPVNNFGFVAYHMTPWGDKVIECLKRKGIIKEVEMTLTKKEY